MKAIKRRDWLKQASLITAGASTSYVNYMHLNYPTQSITELEGEVTRLLFNENPYGPSKKVLSRIDEIKNLSHRYATFFQYDFLKLKGLVAQQEGLQSGNIALGHGSTQALVWLGVLYGGEGKEIVVPDPAFDVIGSFARDMGTSVKKVPVDKDLKLDLTAMEAAITEKTSMVVIVNPNNPTSTSVDSGKLRAFCHRVSKKCAVCIDEAYIHYLGDAWRSHSMVDLVRDNPNIMITRTFSKIYGMAGLRMGLLLANNELVSKIEKQFMMGFPGNSPNLIGVAAAMAALEDEDFVQSSVKKNEETKAYVYSKLDEIGLAYVKSDTNFFYFNTGNFKSFKEKMNKEKILVAGGWPSKKNWGRVTLGTPEEVDFFFKTLNG